MNDASKIVAIADKFGKLNMKIAGEEDEELYKIIFDFYYNFLFKQTNSTVLKIYNNISLIDDLL